MLIVMLLLLFLLLIFVWESKKDLMSPAFLLIIGYIITTVCSIYNVERWNSNISAYMLFIVAVGIISFICGEEVASKVKPLNGLKISEERNKDLTHYVFSASTFRCVCLSIICIVITYVVYNEVVRIAYINFRDWGNLLYNFKENIGENQMNSVARLGMRLTKSIAFISAFLLMNNMTECKENRRGFLSIITYLIPIITYIIQSLMTGSRIAVIMLVVGLCFINLTLKYIKSGYKVKINITRFVKIVSAVTIGCVLFYNIQELVGRQQESNGVIDYICTYLGGSYDLFSQFLRENHNSGRLVIETFSGIVDNLQRYFGLMKNTQFSIYPEFRYSQTGILIGNTYTGFRNYYNDFGLFGVILLSFLLGYLFTIVYRSLLLTRRFNMFRIGLLITYSTYLYCILFHFFTDYFYLKFSVGMVIEIIFLFSCVLIVFGKKFKLGKIII